MAGNPWEKEVQYISVKPKGSFHFLGLSSFPPPASFFIIFSGICFWFDSQGGVVVALWWWLLPRCMKCVSPSYSLLYVCFVSSNCTDQWIKFLREFVLDSPTCFFFFLCWSYQTCLPWLFSGGKHFSCLR